MRFCCCYFHFKKQICFIALTNGKRGRGNGKKRIIIKCVKHSYIRETFKKRAHLTFATSLYNLTTNRVYPNQSKNETNFSTERIKKIIILHLKWKKRKELKEVKWGRNSFSRAFH